VQETCELIAKSQMIVIPGGFSGGDEPEGSGKFIVAYFRNPYIRDAVHKLLERRTGLILGICNGFQALIKLGLIPYGRIVDMNEQCATLTFNTLGRHQSMIVSTRIASNKSPWLQLSRVGDIYHMPISHGEGRFIASDTLISELAAQGQIAAQYVNLSGQPSMDLRYNPSASFLAIEAISSPDGRILGKMGHAERTGAGLYMTIPHFSNLPLFEAGVKFFH
jgi:phosphoribosylformylglycinamidine synthase